MYFVAIYSHGPAWEKDDPHSEKKISGHIEHQNKLFEAGKLVMGGPFTDGTGGMAIFDVDSREEVEEILGNDPAVANELYTTELHPYRIAVKRMQDSQ